MKLSAKQYVWFNRRQSMPYSRFELFGIALVALWTCFKSYLLVIQRRARFDHLAFTRHCRHAGLQTLPAMMIVSAVIGLILMWQIGRAYQQISLLDPLRLQACLLAILELVPIFVGILVAVRSGVALASQQSTMMMTGEVDGLLVTGINPIVFTLAPALLAMLMISFIFTVWSLVIALVSAALTAWFLFDVLPSQFYIALQEVAISKLIVALIKPLFFCLLIAPAAMMLGIGCGRTSHSIQLATSRTMTLGVTLVLVGDVLMTITWG